MDLLKPKELKVFDLDGVERIYTISRADCITGRELYAKYLLSNLPKLGEYEVSEQTMLKLMQFVAVETSPGIMQRLTSAALIKNHVPDWETLQRIEMEMLNYNSSFFQQGRISTFLENLFQMSLRKLTEMLTSSSAPSSQAEKQPSTN